MTDMLQQLCHGTAKVAQRPCTYVYALRHEAGLRGSGGPEFTSRPGQ